MHSSSLGAYRRPEQEDEAMTGVWGEVVYRLSFQIIFYNRVTTFRLANSIFINMTTHADVACRRPTYCIRIRN